MNKQMRLISKFWQSWKKFMERVISNIALFGMYFIGIGLTSLIAKCFNRNFLNRNFQKSSWQPVTGSNKLTKMF